MFVAEASDNDSGLPLSLMSELIEFFSFSGQTVLDIMSGFGDSLVPRLSCVGGEKRAWYTLFAHAQFSQDFCEFGNFP